MIVGPRQVIHRAACDGVQLVHADQELPAFLELESATRGRAYDGLS